MKIRTVLLLAAAFSMCGVMSAYAGGRYHSDRGSSYGVYYHSGNVGVSYHSSRYRSTPVQSYTYRTERVWVPASYSYERLPCGRLQKVYHPGRYEYHQVRVPVRTYRRTYSRSYSYGSPRTYRSCR